MEEFILKSGVAHAAAEKHAGPDCLTESLRQKTLLKTGALQDAIFNSAYFSCIATDEKGVIQLFNVGAERMLGYAASDVVNQLTHVDISDSQELIARALALSLEFDTPIAPGFEALVFKAARGIEDIYELTKIRKDGSRVPVVVSVTALRDAQENIIGYLLIGTDNTARKQVEETQARDVAERKKVETQLFESEARTTAILAAAVDAIIIIDASGTIESLNAAAEKLFGYTAPEMVGQNVKMLMPAPYKAEHDGYLRNYTSTGVKKIIGIGREVVGLRKNGATFPMDLAVSEVQTGGRRLVTGIVRDITERKHIARALLEKNVELEHASRMKSEFLATMSHELRTPLNAIIGFSEALKDGLMGAMSDIQHEYIGDIFTSGEHLLSLINDILDLSKVEAGMMTLELEAVDLNLLLSNSLAIVREKAAAQRIRLELDAANDLGLLQLDMRKTKQIIYNLLSNAVKFSASGGRVTLRARRVPRATVGLLCSAWPVHSFPLADNDYEEFLELCVIDTGTGISRENMTKLFQAFSQIDSSLARKFEGTGLGLAMVKQLAELHGGSVAVASAEGEGACFAAWLPLRTPTRLAVFSRVGARWPEY